MIWDDQSKWANNILTPGGLFDYTKTRIRPSGSEAHIQLPLSLGSDPRSAVITGNVCVFKCRGSGELILDQCSRQCSCNGLQWEDSDEEFPWWRTPLRLHNQWTPGNQEVQPEAVSWSLDCSISSHYLLIMQLHLTAQTHSLLCNTQGKDAEHGIKQGSLIFWACEMVCAYVTKCCSCRNILYLIFLYFLMCGKIISIWNLCRYVFSNKVSQSLRKRQTNVLHVYETLKLSYIWVPILSCFYSLKKHSETSLLEISLHKFYFLATYSNTFSHMHKIKT